MEQDRIDGKHYAIAMRMLEKGGRQDIFLGTRDCQGYLAPCIFGEGDGAYDNDEEIGYGLMFHGFDYPDETGTNELYVRFWYPTLRKGVLTFAGRGLQTSKICSDHGRKELWYRKCKIGRA